ncbi:Predicted ATPase (PP-loop superfamily) [Plasmopara halstedii]|uniref:Diphthine--ammonia ligase n=1 Tax=Plasmopara halstedii TaxID=4781 RepID=A0A0P1AWU3_PLAHL|nr:Predicted ATPase (PP-loop superfamily) [Plasmopara halstedii]CEG45936.1 Predicted ATPase (PP-loop superfamily) [Plasmopara halstedii]|eukprot:XP_024582305.1 Predicted ATPase (PP-loop superfamily) [Plasmopara halstedii]
MKVVALVSGGKDSCYAMMECVRFGHEIVCLAHLHPSSQLSADDAEIDSFMFQSVGHQSVELIAKIGDEVEDLFRLLQKVKVQCPNVEGVCTGAIFSSYQRNRVENVCSRVGLTSLSYLWRRDQTELLQEMIDSKIEAILIKIASIGLQPRMHLGKTIAELQPQLMTLKEKYHLNVCGEGGEYETFTLNCPLFKKRIVIDESHVVIHSDDYVAPVAFLSIDKCHLEDKTPASPSHLALRIPRISPPNVSRPTNRTRKKLATMLALTPQAANDHVPTFGQFRDQLHVSGLMSRYIGDASITLEEEIADIFSQIKAILQSHRMELNDVCYVHLYVQDMSSFSQLNAEYIRHLGQHLPPSRSCVEINALANVPARVLIDCFALRGSGVQKLQALRVRRDVLHVKSTSSWAPSCIGPYSQANVLHRALILLAGQIAFYPQTMELVPGDRATQTTQCFYNVCRVLEALDSNLRHVCSSVIYTTGDPEDCGGRERLLADCRRHLLANAELVDVFEDVVDSDESDGEVDKKEARLAFVKEAPLLIVQLSQLPRNALVEVESQALTHIAFKYLRPQSFTRTNRLGNLRFDWQTGMVPRAMCQIVCTASAESSEDYLDTRLLAKAVAEGMWTCILDSLVQALMPWDRVVHARTFYVASAFSSEIELAKMYHNTVTARGKVQSMPGMTFVPVDAIQSNALVALQVTAQDLDKLETELWLHKQI